MYSLLVLAITVSVAIDHVAAENLYCGETYTGTYYGSPIVYNLVTPASARTIVIRTCGLSSWDTKLSATDSASENYENDNMDTACVSNNQASQIAWVSPTSKGYTVTFDEGLVYTYNSAPTGVAFSFDVLCVPTISLSSYMHAVFNSLQPSVDTSTLSCVDDVWHIDAVSTCVGCGNWHESCASDFVHCAGGTRFGYSSQQAAAVAQAKANGGQHPSVPNCPALLECAPGEHRCTNGNCIAPEALCDCSNDCGDASDEDPGYCGYEELFCNGPRLDEIPFTGDSNGYYFTIGGGNRTVVHPRTCTPVTDMDTQLELFDAEWNLIDSNEDCGTILCPSNPLASGFSTTVPPGMYNVCVKPGANFTEALNDYGIELICVPPLPDYWTNLSITYGLDPNLLACLPAPDNVWEYDGNKTCVGCGRVKDPCDQEGSVRYCTGQTVYGYGGAQMQAVVDATNTVDGAYPGTTCADTYTGPCSSAPGLDVVCLAGQFHEAAAVQVTLGPLGATVSFDDTAYNFTLTQVHVDIQIDPDNFPTTGGPNPNPKIGHFACKLDDTDLLARPFTVDCPYPPGFDYTSCGQSLYTAIHADADRASGGSETMWCPGLDWGTPSIESWATYDVITCPCPAP